MRKTLPLFSIFFTISYLLLPVAYGQHFIDSLENKLRFHTTADTQKVVLLTRLSNAYLQHAIKIDSAHIYVHQALQLAQKLQNPYTLAYAYDSKGVYERSKARYDTAIMYHQKALAIAQQLHNMPLILITNNNLGVAYRRMGDNAMALPYHLRALKLADSIGDKLNLTYSLNSLGNLYLQMGELDKAQQQFKRGYALDTEMQNWIGLAINNNNIGLIHKKKQQYDSALYFIKEALRINQKINNLKGIAICYDDLGTLYHLLENKSEALEHFKRALRIAHKSGDIIYVARIYMHTGELYLDYQQYSKAIYFLEQSVTMATEIKAKSIVQESYLYLSKIYEAQKDYKKSLEYNKLASEYKERITLEETTRQISYLNTKYEVEMREAQKDTEIKLLKKDQNMQQEQIFTRTMIAVGLTIALCLAGLGVVLLWLNNSQKQKVNRQLQTQQIDLMNQKNEIQRQKDELDKANLVKDRLFSIIGHDLRSPFNTIKGFIQVIQVGSLTPEEIKTSTRTIEQQLNNTLNLLNNLLYWSWSQMQGITPHPTEFEMNNLFDTNIQLQVENAKNKNITINNDIKGEIRVKADNNMMNTVVRNLVANAIKFTHPKGQIVISCKDELNRYVFCIADNGVGMSAHQLQNLFGIKVNSTIGTAHEKGTGLGLNICKEFLEKNNGAIWVESELQKGSKFFFTLPKVSS
jgi:two-component system, sensor histidine kinase and response regulator